MVSDDHKGLVRAIQTG
ncbi:MAG: hypothetical protein AB1497_10810 [Bacillota bacterium]